MRQIDETSVGEHFDLEASDRCFYIWEYTTGKGYDFSPTNQLIFNLKIKPSRIATTPSRAYYKQQALAHAAKAIQSLVDRKWVDRAGTFVPIPSSKAPGHEDYDDRIPKVLQLAFKGLTADVRPLIEQTTSTAADHESSERMSHAELLAVSRINESLAATPPRSHFVLVDDVLNSGKHFKVAQQLLSTRFPGTPILGIFLARCVRINPFSAIDIEEL